MNLAKESSNLATTKREGFEEASGQVEESAVIDSFTTRDYNIVLINTYDVRDRGDLFRVFSEQLRFPDYFGNNWDAFYDCLTDLSWLNRNSTLIIIESYELLRTRDFGTVFLDILSDAHGYWRDRGIDFRTLLVNRELHRTN